MYVSSSGASVRLATPGKPPPILVELLDKEEGAEGEGVDSSAVEGADSGAGIGDERLAEEIEAGVDEDGGGSKFAEFVEQAPKIGIGFFFDGVNANRGAVEGKTLETGDGIL